ncbi:MAG: hypothetical protein IT522_14305 [Burkholderiales bacterium]|nr:hypothetical protein [Burkholderiales bacterium]
MSRLLQRLAVLLAAVGVAGAASVAHAADPVKRLRIQVLPYYQAPHHPDDPPLIAVAPRLDKLLASTRADDIKRARDEIERDPARITPMTMMVLAIRLYDVGLRDDAVFWFYVAKHRYYLLTRVADMKSPQLSSVTGAMNAFVRLAGPTINGYAFCDIEQQRKIALTAAEWSARHPYEALLLPEVPGLFGDRQENYQKGLTDLLASVKRERDYLAVPANAERLKALRAQNDADARFCWKP